jgi:hypothetical protein
MPYQEVIAWLQSRLSNPEAIAASQKPVADLSWTKKPLIRAHLRGIANLQELIQLWPVGWSYWGRGIPAPLEDYLTWHLRTEMEQIPAHDYTPAKKAL